MSTFWMKELDEGPEKEEAAAMYEEYAEEIPELVGNVAYRDLLRKYCVQTVIAGRPVPPGLDPQGETRYIGTKNARDNYLLRLADALGLTRKANLVQEKEGNELNEWLVKANAKSDGRTRAAGNVDVGVSK